MKGRAGLIAGIFVIGLLFTASLFADNDSFCSAPVPTREGPVIGASDADGKVCVYQGIPFAEPAENQERCKFWRAQNLRLK